MVRKGTCHLPSLVVGLDFYVVVECTVAILRTGDAYGAEHLVCFFDIVFSGAKEASAR